MTESSPTLVQVPMPQMGVSVTEGTVLAWRQAVGDEVAVDDALCDIATDKVDSEVPCPVDGTLAEILVEPDQTVAVGTPLAVVAATGPLPDGVVAVDSPTPDAATAEGPASGDGTAPAGSGGAPPEAARANGRDGGGNRSYSPVVRRIAAEHDIDLDAVEGTGRNGRVTKRDVLAHAERRRSEPAAEPPAAPLAVPEGSRSEPLSRMRRVIAANMSRSKATAPHAHTWIEVEMTRVERARREVGATALAFVARATIDALRTHPAVNAWLQDDVRTLHSDVNLGIAVALDDEGLIVPVIHRAQELSVEGLAARIRDLATRARAGALEPAETEGGTFTITNPGRYGSLMAAPIINQPQVAILDLEAIAKRPVVVEGPDGEDALAIRPTTVLGLGWDHRGIDGALAAQFLATVRDNLERWPVS